jgi:hypothetical protein
MRVEVFACGIMLETDPVAALDRLAGLAWGGLFESFGFFDGPNGVVVVARTGCCHNLLAAARPVLDVA